MDPQIESLSKRVERVETKIDDMFEVMISMARAEEKLASIAGNLSDMRQDNKALKNKIEALEEMISSQQSQLEFTKKVAFMLLASVLSLAGSVITGIL